MDEGARSRERSGAAPPHTCNQWHSGISLIFTLLEAKMLLANLVYLLFGAVAGSVQWMENVFSLLHRTERSRRVGCYFCDGSTTYFVKTVFGEAKSNFEKQSC